MTTFEIRPMTIPHPKGGLHNYATLAAAMLRSVPQGGFTFLQQEQRLSMLNKLEAAKVGDILEFEEAEIATLVALEPKVTFNVISQEFVDFGKYLRSFAKSDTPAV